MNDNDPKIKSARCSDPDCHWYREGEGVDNERMRFLIRLHERKTQHRITVVLEETVQ